MTSELDHLLGVLPEATLVVDADDAVRAANPAALELWGGREVLGRPVRELAADDDGHVTAELTRWRDATHLRVGFLTFELGDGPVVHRCAGAGLPDGRLVLRVERRLVEEQPVEDVPRLLAELETRRAAEERLTRLAYRDRVTGVLNRAGIEESLGRMLSSELPLALLFVDLDRFKLINDVFGHAAGDAALREVARRLLDTVRPGDVVGRLGGDEFVVILDGVGAEAVEVVGRRVVDALGLPFRYADEHLELSASIGGVVAAPGLTPTGLLASADGAMYSAKRAGGSRIVIGEAGPGIAPLSA